MTRDPLSLPGERIRELGYRAVDLLVDELTDPDMPAIRRAAGAQLRSALGGPPPSSGRTWDELLEQLKRDVLGPMSRAHHPGYFGFIPASGTFPGALGDLIASALDIDAGSWMSAAGPTQLELVVLDWFKEWIGYPQQAAGILLSGGSAANLSALACARETLVGPMSERIVAYVSDQTHASVARAARLLGFRPDQLRVLPTGPDHRMRLDALAGAVQADTGAGLQPLIVLATAGTTNTGAVDPLPELASICREQGLWLHVDAAYGGFACLTERGREQLAGLELADSITMDPHKWLYQPIECGALLVRDGQRLRQAFAINPEYLHDTASDEVNFADYGLQLTRTARALKIWLSINYFGLDAFRTAIDQSIDLAQAAERQIRDAPQLELLSPATLGVVCFRRRVGHLAGEETSAALNAELVSQFESTGRGLVSSTRLHGTYAIRMCVLNHTSGPDDVAAVLDWFAQAPAPAGRLLSPSPDYDDPSADMQTGWAVHSQFDAETARQIPLFRALGEGELELVLKSAREVLATPGETVIARWQGTRLFYAILSGAVEVRTEQGPPRELTAGDYFGELAALDWGGGYGYARTATVAAVTDVRLLALPPAALAELCRRAPIVAEQLRATAQARLRQI